MPNIKSQKDRVAQSKKEAAHNKAIKSNLKTVVKKADAAIAKAFAESEFEKFRVLQDRTYQSDFDRLVANIEENSKQTK